MSLERDSRLGKYLIRQTLGVGGQGVVYRARDTHLGRDVALKTIHGEKAADKELVSRLLSIRKGLESVTSKDFWEITDRGRTFEYMPDNQRSRLPEFFSWLNVSG